MYPALRLHGCACLVVVAANKPHDSEGKHYHLLPLAYLLPALVTLFQGTQNKIQIMV